MLLFTYCLYAVVSLAVLLFSASGCYECIVCSPLFLYRIVVERVYCYFVSVSCSVSNKGLCVSICMSICVSFMCRFSLLVLNVCYLSNEFKCFPFLTIVIMSIVSVMYI
jgi:hypothetical protein